LAVTCTADGLEFRTCGDDGYLATTGTPIPAEAVRVFTYEGSPLRVSVRPSQIAVEYAASGILFDRATGTRAARFTAAEGWPDVRPAPFGQVPAPAVILRGPGVAEDYREDSEPPPPQSVASATFGGRTWRALQPAKFLQAIEREGYDRRNKPPLGWTETLNRLNLAAYVEAAPDAGGQPKRYTMADGLASNIVTHLVAAQGTLWAACPDIYDPNARAWGPGGLCRYLPGEDRWQRIDKIGDHAVRWVTVLEARGEDLWAAFREGDGVEGDRLWFGMGVYMDVYRPRTRAVVVARLSGGQWTAQARPPLPDPPALYDSPEEKPSFPTEIPCRLAVAGPRVFVLSGMRGRPGYDRYADSGEGRLSCVDLATGQWKVFDAVKDFDADDLLDMVSADGEVLVPSSRGVHRWEAKAGAWRFLDPQSDLRNPRISDATVVADELWIGYTNQDFGIVGQQGISRFNEKTLEWSSMTPEEIGTACPVATLAVGPGGDVWALFVPRPYGGSTSEMLKYRREAIPRPWGLGRYSGGKWQFPIPVGPKLENAPTHAMNFMGFLGPGPHCLLALGGRLYVVTHEGVYVGPEPWKKILDGRVDRIAPSATGLELEILREKPMRKEDTRLMVERGTYSPATGQVSFKDLTEEESRDWRHGPLSSPWSLRYSEHGPWIPLPAHKSGKWFLGPLPDFHRGEAYGLVQTPYAVWLISDGMMIRLDRRRLAEWLGK
jgi:hypothetical protein